MQEETMNTDVQIRDDVQRELFYDPGINAASIGVAVQDGIVTLTGMVETYSQNLETLRAAERIVQVKAVACELQVRLPGPYERTDTDLARSVANVLSWDAFVPADRIRIAVEHGWIRLEGTVDWQYQRDSAGDAVACLMGVKGVHNLVNVNPLASAENTKREIDAALKHCATIMAQNILVEVLNDKVALYGEVRSIPEREEAERIAWSAPGISDVANHIMIAESIPGITRPEHHAYATAALTGESDSFSET
jgi:osmotically-inducible protein OsmY